MAKPTKSAKLESGGRSAYTPPKGKPTPGRREQSHVSDKRRKSPQRVRMEWTIAVLVLVVVCIALFIFFGDAFPEGGSLMPGDRPA